MRIKRKRREYLLNIFGKDEEKWHRFEEFVNITYKFNLKKKGNLLVKNLTEEKSKEFINRNLNDTRYIARFMANYISNNLEFAESELKQKVYTINGQATATLRHYWGLSKNREESDKHHAMDAVVIACASKSNIKKISDYHRKKILYDKNTENDGIYNSDITFKEPWPRFREEVMARLEDADNKGQLYSLVNGKFYNYDDVDVEHLIPILVSRKPDKKITGRAHKDTMYSKKFINEGGNFKTVKKPLISISQTDITNIVSKPEFKQLYMSDKAMYDDIFEKMKENNFKADKAFANGYNKYSKKGNGPIVRSITVPTVGHTGVDLKKNNSIAENANMVRVDVFEKDKKFYLVPIYTSDFARKELPNKAIVQDKEWIEMTEDYTFKFSLYKNDLIKVKKKNEKELLTYYMGTDRSNAGIIVLKNPNITGDKSSTKYGSKTLEIFEKYQVDVLGNVYKVKKEKREGIK